MTTEAPKNGLHTKYYPTSQKMSECTYKDGNPYGKYFEWYENGQLKTEGDWVNEGQLVHITWHENGQKESEINYYKTSLHHSAKYQYQYFPSERYTWHENGQKKTKWKCESLIPGGESYGWYENGQKKIEDNLKGLFTWYKDGKKEHESYNNENGTSFINEWYSDGNWKKKEKSPDNDHHHELEEWYPDGQYKAKITNIDNYINQEWYENGQIKSEHISDKGGYKNISQEWYENGQIKLEYINDRSPKVDNSIKKQWYENGQMKAEINESLIFNKIKSENYWDKDGKKVSNPNNQYDNSDDGYDIMNGLTDDERELGRSFWEGIY